MNRFIGPQFTKSYTLYAPASGFGLYRSNFFWGKPLLEISANLLPRKLGMVSNKIPENHFNAVENDDAIRSLISRILG